MKLSLQLNRHRGRVSGEQERTNGGNGRLLSGLYADSDGHH